MKNKNYEFKIEDNIPPPDPKAGLNETLKQLKPGQSVYVPPGNKVHQYVSHVRTYYKFNLVVAVEGEGHRVWRLADPQN